MLERKGNRLQKTVQHCRRHFLDREWKEWKRNMISELLASAVNMKDTCRLEVLRRSETTYVTIITSFLTYQWS